MPQRKSNKTPYPYVYRAIYPADFVDGYIAKVIRTDCRLHQVFQLAGYHGDHEKCMKAAAEKAASFAKKHPRLSRRQIAELPRPKKDTDLPIGVRRVTNIVKGRPYDFYEAEWSPIPNFQKKRRFSVNYWGEKEAKQLAIDARLRGLKEMENP